MPASQGDSATNELRARLLGRVDDQVGAWRDVAWFQRDLDSHPVPPEEPY